MREIIHIQAGPLSNYAGTHYWNAQESYFAYDEDDVSITDHNISFKEGRDNHVRQVSLWQPLVGLASPTPNSQNQPTLCPRLLAFDQKCARSICSILSASQLMHIITSKFRYTCKGFAPRRGSDLAGNLVSSSSPLGMTSRSSCHGRHGGVVRQEQERIPQSEYHSLLDLEDVNEQAEPIATKIRYWSDFSCVFFDPKSIQAVPDTPEVIEGDWNASCETFLRHDDVRILLHSMFVELRGCPRMLN